jgi:hypothetical protein
MPMVPSPGGAVDAADGPGVEVVATDVATTPPPLSSDPPPTPEEAPAAPAAAADRGDPDTPRDESG